MIRRMRAMVLGTKPGILSHTSCLRSCYARQTAQQPRPSPIKTYQNKTISPFKDKLELKRKCEAGIAHSVIAVQMGVPRSTVSKIWKNRDKYHKTAASCKCFYFQKCTVHHPNVFNKKS
ncbi:hypothetical protein E2C01_054908 [Portunus trituberculatus]|uniref:HTH psq-type domain-containing protein n=1 Tax=Portunus trituberculatus TaxID=210409 RepID=A0A5B7GT73_PORTR|nr:hypothetical protein [Portunus trituberculatus]